MAKDFAKVFYNSKDWKDCRRAYIEERVIVDGGMCEVCGERPGTIVHHVKKLTALTVSDPEIALNHKLLRLECKACHDAEEEHFNDARGQKKLLVRFDKDGNPHPLTPPCPAKKFWPK